MDPLELNPDVLRLYGLDPDVAEAFQSRVDDWMKDGSFAPGSSSPARRIFSIHDQCWRWQ